MSSCSHPLKGFKYGKTKNGKDNYIITSYDCDHIEIMDDKIYKIYNAKVSPRAEQTIKSFSEIPCGHCTACRLEHSRQWANRCMLEMEQHEENCFITLTYNDENMPITDTSQREFEYGEYEPIPYKTLRRKDLTKFIKRLRWSLDYYKYGKKIKIFASGEYSPNGRPHYHIIIFGWKPKDLEFYKRSSLGYNYYVSSLINKLWPFGYAVIGEATWETCAYTARYVMKKVNNNLSAFFGLNGIENEFMTCSLRPAIGKEWYTSHNQYYANFSSYYAKTDNGSRPIYHTRYFDKLFDIENHELYTQQKEKRKEFAESKSHMKMKKTSKTYTEMLKAEEENLQAKTKALVRKDV